MPKIEVDFNIVT